MRPITRIAGAGLFTFLLGYTLSTATASQGIPAYEATQRPLEEENATDAFAGSAAERPLPTSVEVNDSRPEAFRHTAPNVINRPEGLNRPFDILLHSERSLRVLQIGDSHIAGRILPDAVRTTLQSVWGTEGDNMPGGIDYDYFARNGATTQYFNTPEWMEKIAEARPDLIILSFGTNECHSMRYSETTHRANLTAFLDHIAETCPEATVMLTTPPGDYLGERQTAYVRRRGTRRRTTRTVTRANPMVERGAALIERVGQERGLPVWNLNALAGGADAAQRWNTARMMRPDRVHFTPEGYRLQGRMLGEAILNSYNQYCAKQQQDAPLRH